MFRVRLIQQKFVGSNSGVKFMCQPPNVFVTSCRYVPSQGDVVVFNAVGKPPNCKYVNALRWYNHIASYSDDEQLAYVQ